MARVNLLAAVGGCVCAAGAVSLQASIFGHGAGNRIVFILLAGGLIVLAGRLFVAAFGGVWSELRLGVPRVELSADPVAVGDELRVRVKVTPARAVHVERVVVDLRAFDVTTHETDRGSTREQEVEAHSAPKKLRGAAVGTGETKKFSARLPVPAVWSSLDGRLRWRVHVKVAYRGAADWEDDFPIRVTGSPISRERENDPPPR